MRGFTLVETLVALLIFGLIAVACVTVMRTTLVNQGEVRARVEDLAALQRLRAAMKADLGQAVDRPTRDGQGRTSAAGFIGGGPGPGAPLLALVRRGWENPDGRPRASLQYVEYRIADHRLERLIRTALDGAQVQDPQVLAEGVQGADVAFYAERRWNRVWRGPGLPEAVRVDIDLDGVGEVSQLFVTPGAEF